MRWRCLCLLLLVCGAHRAVAGELPYAAYVNADDVYVRSGPGRNYYPTEKLQRGARVEVYRHDPGGWLAIRPPRASFAWVNKRHLDPADDGLATVNADRVAARVGSTFSNVRDVIQVFLEKGELVELAAAPRDDSPWCKIAPPSGEFRWIFSKYVNRDLPADLAADDLQPSDVRLASSEQETPAADERAPLGQSAGTRLAPSVDNSSSVGRDLNRLELELSAMIVEDISAWSFDDLRQQVESVRKRAETPVERGCANILLAKIERFDDIRRRHAALQQPAAAASRMSVATTTDEGHWRDTSHFDGVGSLSPVISQKVGSPEYALVDENNAVISFVTPAPGVNLRPYVDHYVGVNGQRGYLTDLRRQHISVQRVTVLETARR